MGGTDKAAIIKGQSGKGKECVSEATISKLLNDFNCANLLTSSRPAVPSIQRSSDREKPHPNYEEVVSSLKHLHLKKPIDRRSKRKEKKILERKAKAVSANKYNLSVAAVNAQKPVLWPGKLNVVSRKIDSDSVLQPPKLSLACGGDRVPCSSLIVPSFHISSSEEKSRIADRLNRLDQSLFANSKTKEGNQQASFSELCEGSSRNSKGSSLSSDKHLQNTTHSLISSSTSVKDQAFRQCSSTKYTQSLNYPGNHNDSCNRTLSSTYRNHNSPQNIASSPIGCSDLTQTQSLANYSSKDKTNLPGNSAALRDYGNSCNGAAASLIESTSSDFRQSSSVSPATNSLALERSCSEEVRMEESSNVNELASYFEDLLHIPRKMSVMAEMMYA